MINLFTAEKEIEIIKLTSEDVIKQSDNLKIFSELIKSHEPNYPEIGKWLKGKVFEGIKTSERTAWFGLANGQPIASAVVKHGDISKFCHLHISENERDKNIGDVFFSMMALEIKRSAKDVFFTLPESLWGEKHDFFQSFGFKTTKKYSIQYRPGEEELICKIPFTELWGNVLHKLPEIRSKFSDNPKNPAIGVLFSIRPKYAEKIMTGEKTVEIRKSFNKKWKGKMATIYSSKPQQCVLGFAHVRNVVENSPANIWNLYADRMGCTKEEFDEYVQTGETIYAIELTEVNPFPNPITISWLNSWTNSNLKPPQSYSSVENNCDWSNAISVAQILHNRFLSF